MIEKIEKDGHIMAYCTWMRLTRHLQFDPRLREEDLEVCFVDKFWKHPDYPGSIRQIIKQLTAQVLTKNKHLKLACFNRHRTNGNKSSRFYWYNRHQMLNATGRKDNGRRTETLSHAASL